MSELELILRRDFPKVDIRSDQVPMLRMISTNYIAGCVEKDGMFHATVILATVNDLDSSKHLIAKIAESSPEKLSKQLTQFFGGS